jgi:uncharacterized spore protein YtfJ
MIGGPMLGVRAWRRTEGRENTMEIQDVITQARDTMTVKRVFGEPYEKEGVTVIPAARVQGGAGGGGGEGPQGEGRGSGTGFGMNARPVGAFLIRGGEMSWRPAVDVNRIILGAQVVAVVALLTVRAIVKARAKALR